MQRTIKRSRPRARAAAALLAALVLGAVRAPAAHADEYDDVLALYKTQLKRPSLNKRTRGRTRLASTGDLRAIAVLADDYLHPEEPKDNVRYLIATLATEKLAGSKEAAPLFADWRGKARQPIDAWLWYRALIAERGLGSTSAVEVAQKADQFPLFRAAALRALAVREDPETAAVVADVWEHLPAPGPDRELLVEACSAVARTWTYHLKEPATRAVVEKIAKVLDDEKGTSIDARDVVARNLARLFQTDVLGPGSGPYLRELAAAEHEASGAPPPETTYAGPFFGLRAIGRRVVYVIDASDSMLTPLTPGEQKKIKVVTGEPPKDGGGSKPTPKKDEPEPLNWQRIKNRFDAAREVLKVSLRALKPDQSFCVILFGDDAKPIPTTTGLRPADAKTVAAAIADLDAIKPAPAPGDKARPNGKLRGETNLHGGIRMAFRVTTAKSLGPGEYTDRSRTGCDAIYVLSDGVPCTDDFRRVDKRDPDEHTVKDRETMTPTADTPETVQQGPYGYLDFESFDYITDDILRMNLFRQVEMHCVAIGEANDGVLRQIAEIGGGKFRRVGDEEAASGGK